MEMQETPMCQKAEQGGDETPPPPPCMTTAIKICDCDCDCDCGCCIDRLYSSLKTDPKMWKDHVDNLFAHTLLHDAAAAGQTTLAVEIMNLMPSLGRKLNERGLSPLHMAVEKGKAGAGATLALAKLDKQLVSIKGRGGMTPLHYAAAAAADGAEVELGLLAGLLAECPEAMGVLNNRRQTAVHVALECRNVEAARLLVNWLIIVAKESLLSIKDARGNTTLHVAAQYCDSRKKGERDLLQLLIKLVKIYKANNSGETPLDVAIHHRNKSAIEILQSAGAKPRNDENNPGNTKKPYASKAVRYLLGGYSDRCAEMLTRCYYFLTKELTLDMRNTILVVAVLIATTTYQGVLQPPGGVYSAEGTGRLVARRRLEHPPGRMVMGTTKYSYFMPTNTLAFISSTLIIIFVLPDRAFVMILQACLIFMCISYLLALNFISYYNNFSKLLDIVCGATLGVAFALKLVYYFVKAYYNPDEWLLRRLGVMVKNYLRARFVGRKREDGELSVLRRMRQQYKLISKRG